MNHPALLDALRQKAEGKASAIWQEAEAEVERIRAEASHRIEEKRAQSENDLAMLEQKLLKTFTVEAEREVRKIRVAAKNTLADRLYRLALESLPRFRNQGYEDLFAALAGELPTRQWQRVKVNPADQSLARRYFPNAQVVPDQTTIGGMEVEGEEGRIRIINTLEKRLERAWPGILPDLLESLCREFLNHESTA